MMVACPTSTPATSVIALLGPGLPLRGTPSARALVCALAVLARSVRRQHIRTRFRVSACFNMKRKCGCQVRPATALTLLRYFQQLLPAAFACDRFVAVRSATIAGDIVPQRLVRICVTAGTKPLIHAAIQSSYFIKAGRPR